MKTNLRDTFFKVFEEDKLYTEHEAMLQIRKAQRVYWRDLPSDLYAEEFLRCACKNYWLVPLDGKLQCRKMTALETAMYIASQRDVIHAAVEDRKEDAKVYLLMESRSAFRRPTPIAAFLNLSDAEKALSVDWDGKHILEMELI